MTRTHPAPFDAFVRGFQRLASTPARPPEPSFEGILIAAPSTVPLWTGRRASESGLPLSGLLATDGGRGSVAAITFAVTTAGGAVRLGRTEAVPNPARPPRGLPPPSTNGVVVTRYFNVDLADLLELPPMPAVCFAFAFLGAHVSNVVRIAVGEP